jgi:hypothetical protein
MNQIEMIDHYKREFKDVLSEAQDNRGYDVRAFFNLQGAKIGMPVKELLEWSATEHERLHSKTLDYLDVINQRPESSEESKSQVELISFFVDELKKVSQSHDLASDYVSNSFFKLQAAKIGMPTKEIFKWSNEEISRLHEKTLNYLDILNAKPQTKISGKDSTKPKL